MELSRQRLPLGRLTLLTVCALASAACTQVTMKSCADAAVPRDGATRQDLATAPPDAAADGGVQTCSAGGNPGVCMATATCTGLPSWSAVSGLCAGGGAACCVLTPAVANNPPVPSGWSLMQQSQMTAEITAWATQILDSPALYPIFSTTLRTFGSLTAMARVEWQPPDFQNNTVHRGVTLYVP